MSEADERQECIERILKYEAKFKRSLDLLRCIGGSAIELELLHEDKESKDKIVAAVHQILKGASALELAISEAIPR